MTKKTVHKNIIALALHAKNMNLINNVYRSTLIPLDTLDEVLENITDIQAEREQIDNFKKHLSKNISYQFYNEDEPNELKIAIQIPKMDYSLAKTLLSDVASTQEELAEYLVKDILKTLNPNAVVTIKNTATKLPDNYDATRPFNIRNLPQLKSDNNKTLDAEKLATDETDKVDVKDETTTNDIKDIATINEAENETTIDKAKNNDIVNKEETVNIDEKIVEIDEESTKVTEKTTKTVDETEETSKETTTDTSENIEKTTTDVVEEKSETTEETSEEIEETNTDNNTISKLLKKPETEKTTLIIDQNEVDLMALGTQVSTQNEEDTVEITIHDFINVSQMEHELEDLHKDASQLIKPTTPYNQPTEKKPQPMNVENTQITISDNADIQVGNVLIR